MAKKLYEWKPIFRGLLGRPKSRWENDIKEDLGIVKINNWTKCIYNRVNGRKQLKWLRISSSKVAVLEEEGEGEGEGEGEEGEGEDEDEEEEGGE